MTNRLGHIASIQTGIFARPVAQGDIVYLQARHFDHAVTLHQNLHADLPQHAVAAKHLLQPGDVLYAAKGVRNFAVVFNLKQPCVASTTFFVIRLKENSILPEYLAWLLNHPETELYLKTQAKGTSMASMRKEALEQLPVDIPDIHKQQLIVKIFNLRNKQKQLRRRLEDLRDVYIQQQLLIVAKNKRTVHEEDRPESN